MKSTITVVVLFAIAVFSNAESRNKYVPAFVESFQKLHRGPADILVTTRDNVETKWITQNLDHFDKQNKKTWQMVGVLTRKLSYNFKALEFIFQRYLVNEEYFENGGPMFIYLGGEWEISPGYIQSGIIPDLAKEHKAILFYTEHRYYGESTPTR